MTTRYSRYALLLASSALVIFPLLFFYHKYGKNTFSFPLLENVKEEDVPVSEDGNDDDGDRVKSKYGRKCLILYATTTGTSKTMAKQLLVSLQRKFKYEKNIIFQLKNIQDFDEEKLHEEDIVFFAVSTWNEGQPVESAVKFMDWLRDVAYDFRWDKNHLEKLQYAMFGIGSAVYKEHFCSWVSCLPTSSLRK
jgi:sulfite reductase alpha subunit-like flavoprotein